MNKTIIHSFFMFAVSCLLPLSLTGCGEDAQGPGDGGTGTDTGKTAQMTKFTSRPDGTRTSLSNTLDASNRYPFYWEAGDNIWVDRDGNGSFDLPNCSLVINSSDRNLADFFFPEKLAGRTYNLAYTGNHSSTAAEVTIAATQTQSGWNSSDHLGTSGDCGTATATQNASGDYNFELQHKASYLIFQPYKAAVVSDNWKLTGIEITADGTNIAGTYPFSTSGLDTNPANVTDASSTITLTWGDEYLLNTSASDAFFVVMQPGTHTLTIKYTVKPSARANGVLGATFNIIKTIDSRDYKVNGVTFIKHELGAESYSTNLYHMWDATNHYWHPSSPSVIGNSSADYPYGSTSTRWHNTGSGQASNSCKNLPNVNAATWYAMRGDPRFERNMPWCLDGNYANIYTRGAWFLKWEHITGNGKLNSGNLLADFKNSTYTAPGTDGVQHNGLTTTLGDTYRNSSTDYQTKGRPAPSEIDKYFFLPALPHSLDGKLGDALTDVHGCYWTASPVTTAAYPMAYRLGFTNGYVEIGSDSRQYGRPVAPLGWFQ